MKKIIKTFKSLAGFIVIGFVLGIVTAILDINPTQPLFILATLIIVFSYFGYSFWKSWIKPISLINQGKYDEAIQFFMKVEEKNKDTIGYRSQALVNIALCLNLKGEFEESLEKLNELKNEKMDKNLRVGFLTLYASNLTGLDRDYMLVKEYVDEAYNISKMPSILIGKAHVALTEGDMGEADRLIEESLRLLEQEKSQNVKWGFESTLVYMPDLNNMLLNHALGLYYYRINSTDKSKYFFIKVIEYPHDNYYVAYAKKLLLDLNGEAK
ncbi:tetratricopeptide repeat protein [Desulfuribacillus alkaliarsenatis]|uniref:Tetratricopeptide repeat protein n=1 Tax=Desulfuribacillus alkaliarsenatis TaxID=766136 RepID=A0A1E5FYU4_9FIRM|nr:hypothetical protein [Desulfuribacillus alkaliarsenatis]OEF95708.1 hypothetical protein BHF68_11415 [Desulfuribacillus alkaliarsenatis]